MRSLKSARQKDREDFTWLSDLRSLRFPIDWGAWSVFSEPIKRRTKPKRTFTHVTTKRKSDIFRLLIDLLFNGFRSWLAEEYYLRLVLQIRSNILLSYVPYGPIGTPIELVLSSNQPLSAGQ